MSEETFYDIEINRLQKLREKILSVLCVYEKYDMHVESQRCIELRETIHKRMTMLVFDKHNNYLLELEKEWRITNV